MAAGISGTSLTIPLRRSVRLGAAWAFLAVLGACSANDAPLDLTTPATQPPPAAANAATRARTPALVRGYYEGRDGGLFTVCGESSRRRVDASQATSRVAKVLAEAGERPRFLVANGDLVGQDAFRILALDLMTTDAFDCDSRLDDVVFAGRGTDSLWTLEVTPAAITFASGPGAAPEIYPHVDFELADLALVSETANAGGTLRIELRAAACPEKMTATTFGLAAKISTRGKTYTGCAWRGLADD